MAKVVCGVYSIYYASVDRRKVNLLLHFIKSLPFSICAPITSCLLLNLNVLCAQFVCGENKVKKIVMEDIRDL